MPAGEGMGSRSCSLQLQRAQQCFVFLAETAALAILLDSKGSGVELMKHEYHLHCEEPGVAEALCLLMNEMVQYGEIAAAGT